jgi:hypothetical protein
MGSFRSIMLIKHNESKTPYVLTIIEKDHAVKMEKKNLHTHTNFEH